MIPIDCEITNLSLHLFVCFFKDYHNYFLVRAYLLISGKRRTTRKSISTINPVIMENMKYSIIEVRAPFISLKVGMSLDHDVPLSFVSSSSNILGNIPSKE